MTRPSGFLLIFLIAALAYPNYGSGAERDKPSIAPTDTIAYLNIPQRPDDAADGSVFASLITGLSLDDREKAVVEEILAGNVPSFSRKLKPLKVNETVNGKKYELIFFTVCDYLAIGSEQDYLYMPMRPSTAQYLADRLGCSLPTKKMVDIIYAGAEIKLRPQPIPPSDKMTTVPVFYQHTDSVKTQIAQLGLDRAADNIIAGHKKDVIISNKIYSSDRDYRRVVIYGWHLSENNPIQPVYNGHSAEYADYSHGIRLICKTVFLNGDSSGLADILKDSQLNRLLSDEGAIAKPYYPPSDLFTSMGRHSGDFVPDFELYPNYPNPFNPSTVIRYRLSARPGGAVLRKVELSVYNVLGEKVVTLVDEKQPPGRYSVEWRAQSMASGLYFYKLRAGLREKSRKMILAR